MHECKICKTKCKNTAALASHFSGRHKIKAKDYYDRFLKINSNEGSCVICSKPSPLISFTKGYQKTCSKSCARKLQWATNKDYREMKIRNSSETMSRNNKEIFWKDEKYRQNKSDAMKKLNEKQRQDEEFLEKMRIIKSLEMKENRKNEEFNRKQADSVRTEKERKRRSQLATQRHIETPHGFVGKGTRYKQGWFYSKKNKCKLYYQSSYELLAFELFEKMNTVKAYVRCRFSIDYVNPNDKTVHQYVPDVEVYYIDGSKQIIEIKAEWQLEDEINKAKFDSAKKQFGDDFIILTQNDLN